MKISVIIPVYKVEKYIRQCLDSVVRQSFDDFEVICVDDCSPDYSMEVVNEYMELYPNICVVKNKQNGGLSYSRNAGIRKATGEYILFVDSDDYIKDGTLKQLYEYASEHRLDVVYFNKRYFYDDEWIGEKKQNKNKRFGEDEIFTGREMFVRFHYKHVFKSMNAYTQFFRRDFLIDNNLFFYDGIVHEDYLFYFLCAMTAERTGNLDRDFYFYRKRGDSITGGMTEERKQSIFVVLMEVLKYWREHSFSNPENEAIRRFCDVIYANCISYRDEGNYHDALRYGDDVDRFLYNKIMNTKYADFSNDEIELMHGEEKVWIYGAGKVGRDTALELERKRIKIGGFLVSDSEQAKGSVFGWQIFAVDEAPIHKESLIVVAADGRFKNEIRSLLKKKGFCRLVNAVKTDKRIA